MNNDIKHTEDGWEVEQEPKYKRGDIVRDMHNHILITDIALIKDQETQVIYKGVKIVFQGELLTDEKSIMYQVTKREDMYEK